MKRPTYSRFYGVCESCWGTRKASTASLGRRWCFRAYCLYPGQVMNTGAISPVSASRSRLPAQPT